MIHNKKWYLKNAKKVALKRLLQYRANPKKINEYQREWRVKNPEKAKDQDKRKYQINRKNIIRNSRQWALQNREKSNGIKRDWYVRKTYGPEFVEAFRLIRNIKGYGNGRTQ